MAKDNIIEKKSFEFAILIVKLTRSIQKEQREYTLSKQLLRSGTAIGAIICEAEHAESKKDFIHKMSIALKEANETYYWLKLLHSSDQIDNSSYTKLKYNIIEIVKILTAILNTAKTNLATK